VLCLLIILKIFASYGLSLKKLIMFIPPYRSLSALGRATVQSLFTKGKPDLHHSELFSLEDLPGDRCSHRPLSALTLPAVPATGQGAMGTN